MRALRAALLLSATASILRKALDLMGGGISTKAATLEVQPLVINQAFQFFQLPTQSTGSVPTFVPVPNQGLSLKPRLCCQVRLLATFVTFDPLQTHPSSVKWLLSLVELSANDNRLDLCIIKALRSFWAKSVCHSTPNQHCSRPHQIEETLDRIGTPKSFWLNMRPTRPMVSWMSKD